MSKFWQLLEESVIVQALVTLALTGSVVYLTVSGQAVPDSLLNLTLVALGYYFGSKTQLSASQAAKAVVQQLQESEGNKHAI